MFLFRQDRDPLEREADPMHAIYVDLVVVLGAIVAAGLLAMSELAIGSASRSRLRHWSGQGYRGAAAALVLSEQPKRLLGTVQLGTTLLATLAGVYSGLTLVPRLSAALEASDRLAPYAWFLGLGLTVVAITLVSLVLGDLVPRRFALLRPDRIARLVSLPMRALAFLAVPFIGFLSAATDLLLRALGLRPAQEPPVTEEEISVLLQEGTKAGVFEEGEHEMIKRVFRFSDRRARALMTPRDKIVWIDLADPPDEIHRKVIASHHTRFPVCDQSLDNLLGIVKIKDLLTQDQNAEPFRIKGRLTMPLFLYEGTRGLKILEMFKKSTTRVAVVLDEYGTVEGLLTLTDILEAIVGDMPVGGLENEPAAVERADGSWLIDGRMALDDFRDLFGLTTMPEGDFHTLAGLVVTQLGHIPRVAECLECCGLSFEVVDMDGNRVDRILVKEKADSSPE
jgi:putative hemolysin